MCWNAEVSLQSFLIGMIAIAIGYSSHIPMPVLLFCFTIVCMQLIEYIVWTHYSDPLWNSNASFAAVFLLWLQPIASISTLTNVTLQYQFLSAYGLLSVLGLVFLERKDFSMTKAPNGHLQWNWLTKENDTYLSLSIYFLFLLVPLLLQKNYTLLTLALGTLGVSLYSFYQSNTWGSMWCWMVNLIVLGVIGNGIYLK
jgi:hypothetical protein